MRIELDLYTGPQLRAYAKFCEDMAKIEDGRPKDRDNYTSYGNGGLESIIEEVTRKSEQRVTTESTGQPPTGPATISVEIGTVEAPPPETPAKPRRGRPAKAAQGIQSDPENRVDPAVKAQDDADEAAEQKASTELTHDDVRKAMKGYLDKYGTPAAMEDGPKILGVPKISDIGKDATPDAAQAALSRAIDDVASAIANNPFERAEVAA